MFAQPQIKDDRFLIALVIVISFLATLSEKIVQSATTEWTTWRVSVVHVG